MPMPISTNGNLMPAEPAMPASAMTDTKLKGTNHSARPPQQAANNPTATIAKAWSMPLSGCKKPCAKPWVSPVPIWADAATGTNTKAATQNLRAQRTILFVSLMQVQPSSAFTRDRMCLPDCTACRTIRDVRPREFERAPAVIAATGVELRGMIREREQMFAQKLLEATACSFELYLGFFEPVLRNQHVGKTPSDLWIAARECRQE